MLASSSAGETSERSTVVVGIDSQSRLKELHSLLRAGMISEDEYEKKRAEILSEL